MTMHCKLHWPLPLLVITVCAAEATVSEAFYEMVDEGQNITGTLGAELSAQSKRHCSIRQVIAQRIFKKAEIKKLRF